MKRRSHRNDGLPKFADALRITMAARGLKQSELAQGLGTSQAAVSAWVTGKSEPAARTVFDMERLLELPPGSLSRPLGYMPLNADGNQDRVAFEQFVIGCPDMDPKVKWVLVATYRALMG